MTIINDNGSTQTNLAQIVHKSFFLYISTALKLFEGKVLSVKQWNTLFLFGATAVVNHVCDLHVFQNMINSYFSLILAHPLYYYMVQILRLICHTFIRQHCVYGKLDFN